MEDSGLYELKPLPEPDEQARRTNHVHCPVCQALRAGEVCHTCGIDLDTGDFVGIPESVERDYDEDEVELPPPPLPPGVQQGWQPLREYDEHRVPESAGELLARAAQESLRTWVAPVVYAPLVMAALSFHTVPVAGEPFPLPGQLLACFVLSFCLLERSRGAHEEEPDFDVGAIASLLLRSLFLMPLLAGIGQLPLAAMAVIPIAVVLLPVVLGALSTDTLGELTPPALWTAFRATPGYLRTMIFSSVFLGAALAAVWAWPDGNAFYRGAGAVAGATLCGVICGSARRDAELG